MQALDTPAARSQPPKDIDDDDAIKPARAENKPSTGSDRADDASKRAGEDAKGNAFALSLMMESSKYLGDVSRTVGAEFPSFDSIFGKTDDAAKTKKDLTTKGLESASSHEAQFMNLKGVTEQKPLLPGTHNNSDGSSRKVNGQGQITEFTTAPTKDFPNGMTYKNVEYDKNGGVKSFETPWGTKHSRTGEANAEGYGNWSATNKMGQPVKYSGSDSSTWQGKTVIDEKGLHNIVASGPKQWNMYSRTPDGTSIETNPNVEKGIIKGFTTTTTLADKTELRSNSTYQDGKLVRDPKIEIVDSKEKQAAAIKDKPPAVAKEKTPEARPAENKLGVLANLLDSDKLSALDNVNSISVRKTTNSNEFKVDVDLKNAVSMPAPNLTITGLGPFGGASARPKSSSVGDFSVNVRTHPEKPGRIDVLGMEEFKGKTDVYGPRGKHRGVRDGHTEWMSFDTDARGKAHVDVKSSGLDKPLRLDSRHMGTEGPMGRMLTDADFRKTVSEGLTAFRDNVDSVSMRRTADGGIAGSFDPKIAKVPLNKPLEGTMHKVLGTEATNLYLRENGPIDWELRTKGGEKEMSFKQGDLQVGIKTRLQNEESKLSVSKIVISKDADGKPTMAVEFYGRKERTKIY